MYDVEGTYLCLTCLIHLKKLGSLDKFAGRVEARWILLANLAIIMQVPTL